MNQIIANLIYTYDKKSTKYIVHENSVVFQEGKKYELSQLIPLQENQEEKDIFLLENRNRNFMVFDHYELMINNNNPAYSRIFYVNNEIIKLPEKNKFSFLIFEYKEKYNFSPIACSVNTEGKIEVKKNQQFPQNQYSGFHAWKSAPKISVNPIDQKYIDLNKSIILYSSSLFSNFPERKYTDTENEKNIHYGQLKLLISEIEFLINKNQKLFILYIGAAPGHHLTILSQCFPENIFICFDATKFGVNPSNNLIFKRRFFVDYDSEFYASLENLLLISDIRGNLSIENSEIQSFDKFEEEVSKNLEQQKNWVLDMKPQFSLLKFRFPFTVKNYTYFPGEINFQVFAPVSSSETRLVVSRKDIEKQEVYDTEKYNNQLYFFNLCYRSKTFYEDEPVFGISFDFCKTAKVIRELLKSMNEDFSDNSVYSLLVVFINAFKMNRNFPKINKLINYIKK